MFAAPPGEHVRLTERRLPGAEGARSRLPLSPFPLAGAASGGWIGGQWGRGLLLHALYLHGVASSITSSCWHRTNAD